MGTSRRNVLMVCVAAILTVVVTACSGNPQSAPASPTVQPASQTPAPSPDGEKRVVSTVFPVLETTDMLQEYSIVVGASTLSCTTQSPLELSLTGPTKGYKGEITVQKFDSGLVRINWDSTAVRSIIVNKKLWAPIDTSSAPPLATNLRLKDWGGEITSITGCNWGM